MAQVGVLPTPDTYDAVLPQRLKLFGFLATAESSSTIVEDCHFCLLEINRGEENALTTPCCRHFAHAECFNEWLFTSADLEHNENAKCAYCRRDYEDYNFCYLCLKKTVGQQELLETSCCRSSLHKTCVEELRQRIAGLSFRVSLTCGQPTYCGCLWIGV